MSKKLQIIFNFSIIFLISISISKAELLKPSNKIKPSEVVKIQLVGLQKNNYEFEDSGIEQTWNFAHPNNKKVTGPLEKFKRMIKGEKYTNDGPLKDCWLTTMVSSPESLGSSI